MRALDMKKYPTLTKKPSFSRKNTAFQCTGITAAQIPVFGIDLNTGIPVLGIGIAIPTSNMLFSPKGKCYKYLIRDFWTYKTKNAVV